jgi:large subunit ribosomal protein L25
VRSVTNLDVKFREEKGTARCNRLRAAGRIPGVIYGAGGACVDVSMDAKQLTSAVKKGLAQFQLAGDVTEKVTLQSVQYDGLGTSVLHVDLLRA